MSDGPIHAALKRRQLLRGYNSDAASTARDAASAASTGAVGRPRLGIPPCGAGAGVGAAPAGGPSAALASAAVTAAAAAADGGAAVQDGDIRKLFVLSTPTLTGRSTHPNREHESTHQDCQVLAISWTKACHRVACVQGGRHGSVSLWRSPAKEALPEPTVKAAICSVVDT